MRSRPPRAAADLLRPLRPACYTFSLMDRIALLRVFVLAACCVWPLSVTGQETPSATPTPGESVNPPPTPPSGGSEVPAELRSDYVVRTYKVRPAKLWKGLLESLTSAGFPPEEVDEEKRVVKT